MKHVTHVTREELIHLMDGEIEGAERMRVETHLANCDECLAHYEDLAGLSESVNRLIETTHIATPVSARQSLETVLVSSTVAAPVPAAHLWRWVAVAAAIVLALLLLRQRPAPKHEIATRTAQAPSATPQHQTETASAPDTPAKPFQRARAISTLNTAHYHYTSSFIRLPYSDPSLPLNSADVVRVEMHLSALANAGIVRAQPVAGDPLVQADVLLGLDGQPSAIRLLQPGSTN